MVTTEIKEFLNDYFDVLQTQDMSKFDRVFHSDCVLYSAPDGNKEVFPFAAYRQKVMNRESPQSRGFKPNNEILTIDALSPEMAMAKVRLHLFDNIMVDYLLLFKVDGKWSIASKMYHKEGAV